MIALHDALCCLLSSVVASADEDGRPEFAHVYPTAAFTWPYCDHHAVIGREIGPTLGPPPSVEGGDFPAHDARTSDRLDYDRFEIGVVRCGPPIPDGNQCLDDLYGDCSSDAGVSTLAGHHRLVSEEATALRKQLLNRWCDCLTAVEDGKYSKTRARWIESETIESSGRFTVTTFVVATLLR